MRGAIAAVPRHNKMLGGHQRRDQPRGEGGITNNNNHEKAPVGRGCSPASRIARRSPLRVAEWCDMRVNLPGFRTFSEAQPDHRGDRGLGGASA